MEEALVNAVYHRAYDVREPVEVRVMHDELVVLSFPGPDRSVRLEQLRAGRAHARRYRNRRIGEFLKELKFTEGRSTGIPKILRAMALNGSPPAEFEFDDGHTYFQVRLPVHPAANEENESDKPFDLVQSQPAVVPRDPVVRLLLLLEYEEQSSGFLRKSLQIKHRDTFRQNYLRPCLERGLIEFSLPEKPSSRLQRYRITELGRRTLGQLRQESMLSRNEENGG